MTTLPNIHPGEILKEEFLIPFDLSQQQLAEAIHIPVNYIADICNGQRDITAGIALRLSRFFGTTPAFWLGLQADYDTEEAEKELHDALNEIYRYIPEKLKNHSDFRMS